MSMPTFQHIHEVYTTSESSAAGVLTNSRGISPAQLILAARLTGYRAIADEIRIDHVTITLTPALGRSSTGRVVLYLERDSTAASVATVPLAMDQREKVAGPVYSPLTLSWRPQEPDDRQFNLLNPGTVSLGNFFIVGDNITDVTGAAFAGVCYSMSIIVDATLRGRP